MTYNEFMEIAGYEVSYKDYHDIIEPMYMSVPNVSKQDFVKMIDKKKFALKTKKQLVKEMQKIAEEIKSMVEHTGAYDLKSKLEGLAHDYVERFYGAGDYYFSHGYTGFNMRGCSYPTELIIYHGQRDYERVKLA